MVKLNRESLESIQAQLGTVDESWQTEFNLREVVKTCFYLIENARKHKVSWEKITEVIKHSAGITDEIAPASVSKYYLDLAKNPKLLPKKKRTNKGEKKTPENSNPESTSTINGLPKEAMPSSLEEQLEASSTSSQPRATKNPREKFGAAYKTSEKKAEDEFNL